MYTHTHTPAAVRTATLAHYHTLPSFTSITKYFAPSHANHPESPSHRQCPAHRHHRLLFLPQADVPRALIARQAYLYDCTGRRDAEAAPLFEKGFGVLAGKGLSYDLQCCEHQYETAER